MKTAAARIFSYVGAHAQVLRFRERENETGAVQKRIGWFQKAPLSGGRKKKEDLEKKKV